MMSTSSLLSSVALLLVVRMATSDDWEQKTDEKGRQVQSLKIQAPSMTEEDQYGYTMPEQYRCDSCKVVAYHLDEALKARQPKNKRMPEWKYHELFDETCATAFSGYGVALINGENALSGPALKRDNVEPGEGAIQMGGETWEKRLGEICRKFVYEKVGEDELYDHFRAKGEVSSELCFTETRDCKKTKLGPEALPQVKKTEKASEKTTLKQRNGNVVVADTPAMKEAKSISVSTFISRLAKKHGLATVEYTKKRTFEEWEKFLVLAAQRIHSEDSGKPASEVYEV